MNKSFDWITELKHKCEEVMIKKVEPQTFFVMILPKVFFRIPNSIFYNLTYNAIKRIIFYFVEVVRHRKHA